MNSPNLKKVNGYVHIYECDTEIKRDYPFKKYDGNFTGRGGTNLEPVLKKSFRRKI